MKKKYVDFKLQVQQLYSNMIIINNLNKYLFYCRLTCETCATKVLIIISLQIVLIDLETLIFDKNYISEILFDL